MKTILSGKASKLLDKYTIEYIGIPSLVLMENGSMPALTASPAHNGRYSCGITGESVMMET